MKKKILKLAYLGNIEDLMNGGIDDPEFVETPPAGEPGTPPAGDQATPPVVTPPVEEPGTPPAEEPTPDSKQASYSSPFFSKKADDSIEAMKAEDFVGYAKEKLNIDVEKDGWRKLANSIEKSRVKAQEATALKSQLDGIQKDFDVMPLEIAKAIDSWSRGEDWRQPLISSKPVTFEKDFNLLTIEEKVGVVNSFFPKAEISSDEIDLKDPIQKQYLELAEAKYNTEKEKYNYNKTALSKKEENKIKAFNESIENSREFLSKSFEGFEESQMSEIDEIVKSKKIGLIFFNEDGTLRQDAYKKIAFAVHGENILKDAELLAESKAKSLLAQELIKRESGRGTGINNNPNNQNLNNNQEGNPPGELDLVASLFPKDIY